VVEVSVGEDYGIDFFGGNWRIAPVAFPLFFGFLEETAINHKLKTVFTA